MRLFLSLVLMLLSGSAWAACPVPLPFTLLNGTIADAGQVMANFNNVWNCGIDQANVAITGGTVSGLTAFGLTANQTAARTARGHNAYVRDNSSQDPCTGGYLRCGDFNNVESLINNTLGTTITNTNAFAAYILNQTPNLANPDNANSVLFYGVNEAIVNNAHSFGLNPGLNDADFLTGVLLQNEFDVSVFSSGTKAYGLVFVGDSTQQPLDSAAIAVAPLSAQNIGLVKWQRGLWTQDGSSTLAVEIGANIAGVVPSVSQFVYFDYHDGSGLPQVVALSALTTGQLAINSSIAGTNTGIELFNNLSTTANTDTGIQAQTASGLSNFLNSEIGGGVSQTQISQSGTGGILLVPGSGGVILGPPTGTPVASLCLNSSNVIIKKTTAGSCI